MKKTVLMMTFLVTIGFLGADALAGPGRGGRGRGGGRNANPPADCPREEVRDERDDCDCESCPRAEETRKAKRRQAEKKKARQEKAARAKSRRAGRARDRSERCEACGFERGAGRGPNAEGRGRGRGGRSEGRGRGGRGPGNGRGPGGGSCLPDAAEPAAAPASPEYLARLQATLEEELYARDYYKAASAALDGYRRFANLSRAEENHADAIVAAMKRLGGEPVLRQDRAVTVPESVAAADAECTAIERKVIEVYSGLIEDCPDEVVKKSLTRIQEANRRHLSVVSR